jgi:hypothetical protein
VLRAARARAAAAAAARRRRPPRARRRAARARAAAIWRSRRSPRNPPRPDQRTCAVYALSDGRAHHHSRARRGVPPARTSSGGAELPCSGSEGRRRPGLPRRLRGALWLVVGGGRGLQLRRVRGRPP